MRGAAKWIRWFKDVGMHDVGLVGGKNASLGEMVKSLVPRGIQVPNGFAVTSQAYFDLLRANQLEDKLVKLQANLDTQNPQALHEAGTKIRNMILSAHVPEAMNAEIVQAYRQLCSERGGLADVAVRSSATAEDLPDASFAGQQETFLNVQGDKALLDSCLRCFASLFTDRAISYRRDKGYDKMRVGLSIGVQQMVRSDLGSSGVLFTLDTESGFRDVVVINSSYGLGENIVQGSVNPDEFVVFKPTLRAGFRPVLAKHVGSKEMKLVYDVGGNRMTKNVPVAMDDRARLSITENDALTLAKWSMEIEDYYSARAGKPCPMDIEWAKDGRDGALYVVQARPETVHSQGAKTRGGVAETYELDSKPKAAAALVVGKSVGQRIGSGTARVIKRTEDLGQLKQGEVLVTDKTDPDWEPAMRRAAAIVTNRGGRTCHAAIISRELGLPAVVGTQSGTEDITTGELVTVSGAQGEVGYVYAGRLPFTVRTVDFAMLDKPKTSIMMNVGDPSEAFRLSFLPNNGVGLARTEFIINNFIKIHPLALVNYDSMKENDTTKKLIGEMTKGYADKSAFFVDKLAEGVATLAAAFYPKDVIVRMSDFKTNEYANLIGGKPFEPKEENPMIGFRGASRYYNPRYQAGFALECAAMKKVREEMGLVNLKLMVPFCRTLEEGRKVVDEMARHGLVRGANGLEIYVMCEIPSNVILAEEFCDIFDGFSIGSNDLTQLILGVDRDSEIVSHIFDERNAAVKKMISQVIRTCKAKGRKIGICGQAPSDYPEFAQFLVEEGIDSISLNPDAVVKTTMNVLDIESRLGHSVGSVVPPH